MNRKELPSIRKIASRTRYPVQAFDFVRKALDHTVQCIHADPDALEQDARHVSGQQLCTGLRDYALDQYGYMARIVLRRWRVTRTEDFGQIVFAMVNAGIMHAAESDTVHDFDAVYSFDEFDAPVNLSRVPAEGFTPDPVPQE